MDDTNPFMRSVMNDDIRAVCGLAALKGPASDQQLKLIVCATRILQDLGHGRIEWRPDASNAKMIYGECVDCEFGASISVVSSGQKPTTMVLLLIDNDRCPRTRRPVDAGVTIKTSIPLEPARAPWGHPDAEDPFADCAALDPRDVQYWDERGV